MKNKINKKLVLALSFIMILFVTVGCSLAFIVTMSYDIKNTFIAEDISDTIRYHANGGIGSMENQTMYYNVPKALSSNKFTKEHFEFIGWALYPDGDVEYIDEQIVVNIVDEDGLDLYAVWADDVYTVTFDYNDGEGSPDSKKVVGGEEYGVLPTYPTKYHHLFTGWYTEPVGGTRVYPDDIADYEDITLYAQWLYSPANEIILDLIIKNNPDDNKDGIVDDIYLNFACSSYYEKFNVPIENLVPGQRYRLEFTESNDASFGTNPNGYKAAIYGSIITSSGSLDKGSIKNEALADGGLIATFDDVSLGDEWLNGPRNWEMTFTAEAETMYWTWDMGLIQDGPLRNYNMRNIKLIPLGPDIVFETKTVVKGSSSTAAVVSQQNKDYGTEFIFDGASGCETLYFPITGLDPELTYTITFDHKFTGNLIKSETYDYGCGIMNSAPTTYPSKLSALNIISNKFILSEVSNSVESVTLTFKPSSDTAYWVWNMANCSDSVNGTVSINITEFKSEDTDGNIIVFYEDNSIATLEYVEEFTENIEIELDWSGIDDTYMDWYPVGNQNPTVGEDYRIAFEVYDGYKLCDTIIVEIDGKLYKFDADEIDMNTYELVIPGEIIKEETQIVYIEAYACKLGIASDSNATDIASDSNAEQDRW